MENSVVSATFHFMHISTCTFIMTIQNIKVATADLCSVEIGTTPIPCQSYLEKCIGVRAYSM